MPAWPACRPLSLNDIELYPASRTILIDRIEFDAAILALDDARGMSGQSHRNAQQIRKEVTDLPLMVVYAQGRR